MSQNNSQQGAPNTHGSADAALPDDLRGPFLDEIFPEGPYKHRGQQRAAVVYYRNGGHSVVTAQGARHVDRPRLSRQPTSVCLIARGKYQASFEMELPSYDNRGDFLCAVDVHWEVADFALAAEKRVRDVEKMLCAPLLARLRVFTRRYGLDAADAADAAIQDELAGGAWESFGAELGLSTMVYVRIDLGQAARDHRKRLLDVEHASGVRSAQDDADAARVRANLSSARELIAAGKTEQYAILLARDPSQAPKILRELQDEVRQEREGALEFLSRLIENDMVQRHQIEGPVVQQLLDFARMNGGGALFDQGLPQPPVPLPAQSTPALPAPPGAVLPPPTVQQTVTAWHPAASAAPPPVPPQPPTPTPANGVSAPPVPPVPPPVPPVAPTPPPPPAPAQPTTADGKINYVRQGRRRPKPRPGGPGGGHDA
ncbi:MULTISPECIES: hypothetical protein [unclassified Streptomyces]|uniref:hypothetical protein n=1 Tax=unclassified Streptomyces TaxID=2593676 RepID=UPI0035E2F01F